MKKKHKIIILFVIAVALLLWPMVINTTTECKNKDVSVVKVVKNDDR
jgi:ABC-type nitrate/sulfonate/bicarbonate transport system permease component